MLSNVWLQSDCWLWLIDACQHVHIDWGQTLLIWYFLYFFSFRFIIPRNQFLCSWMNRYYWKLPTAHFDPWIWSDWSWLTLLSPRFFGSWVQLYDTTHHCTTFINFSAQILDNTHTYLHRTTQNYASSLLLIVASDHDSGKTKLFTSKKLF